MNLEEKAKDTKSHWMDQLSFVKGGKWIVEQGDLIDIANPKMSGYDMVKELKKLI